LRRAQLPLHIPSVGELLAHCGTAYEFSVDVKDPAALLPLVDAAREVDAAFEPRLWLCSPDVELLAEHRTSTVARLVNSTRLARIPEGVERRVATLRERGIDALNMHHTDWTGGLAVLAHRFERFAFGWDMQQPRHLAAALNMGLDAVYSDHVERMIAAFAAIDVQEAADGQAGP
jgi:glycerophosphoryl diester phosphodiesterase